MRPRFLIWLCLLVAASGARSWADGCYVPQEATLKMPEITAQRALLRWKDGTETLLISSALDSESQKLGWIIPLPAVPSKIEKADPGGLKTLAMLTQPKIIHDFALERGLAIVGMLLLVLITATALIRPHRLLGLFVVILLLVILCGLLLPSLASLGAATAWGTLVEKTARVGSYEIAVLRPVTSAELTAWLSEQGYAALPAAGTPTVAEYINRGWMFATIRLVRDDVGNNAPHPIRIEFATRDPVYPLRLTALGGSSVPLELYVLAETRADTELPVGFCDRFKTDRRGYRGVTTDVRIGHPDITALMWPDCVLTRASARLTPKAMRDDLPISLTDFVPCRERRFSPQGALGLASTIFTVCLGMFLTVSMIVWRNRLTETGGVRRYLLTRCLPALVVSAGISGIVYTVVPKVTGQQLLDSHSARSHTHILGFHVEQVFTNNPSLLAGDADQIGGSLIQELNDLYPPARRPIINPYTGTNMMIESTPGNLTVEKTGDKIFIRIYDDTGYPIVIETK